MRILLDTNAYVALRRGHPGAAESVAQAEEIVLSSIVAGELLDGFRNGTRTEKNLADFRRFLDNPHVSGAAVTLETADRFARIMNAQRKKGRPLPTNDIWIAAQAMETGADLLSFDRHFGEIDGIVWVEPRGAAKG